MLLVLVISLPVLLRPVSGLLWGCQYSGCGANNPHTMCKYPSGVNRFAGRCMGYGAASRETTDDMRKCTLDAHNSFRQKVALSDTDPKQPPAANMMKLKYSMEAERIVQHWINACQEGHDRCRNLLDGAPCGQNLWYTSDGGGNLTQAHQSVCYGSVAAYFSEISFLANRSPEDVEHFRMVHEAGHYTAMVWADITAVGCAWMEAAHFTYPGGSVGRPLKAGCNYVGTPNMVGGSNYRVGQNCSMCPPMAHCSVRYPGLCTYETADEEYSPFSGTPLHHRCSIGTLFVALAFVVM